MHWGLHMIHFKYKWKRKFFKGKRARKLELNTPRKFNLIAAELGKRVDSTEADSKHRSVGQPFIFTCTRTQSCSKAPCPGTLLSTNARASFWPYSPLPIRTD